MTQLSLKAILLNFTILCLYFILWLYLLSRRFLQLDTGYPY
ncbi:hypothetical protein [Pontibacter chinhatensis]|nr:hypothetical protein [Pontibacter chinhatensis]